MVRTGRLPYRHSQRGGNYPEPMAHLPAGTRFSRRASRRRSWAAGDINRHQSRCAANQMYSQWVQSRWAR